MSAQAVSALGLIGFAALAWGWGAPADAAEAGRLLGLKTIINEFVAYLGLARSGAAMEERNRHQPRVVSSISPVTAI